MYIQQQRNASPVIDDLPVMMQFSFLRYAVIQLRCCGFSEITDLPVPFEVGIRPGRRGNDAGEDYPSPSVSATIALLPPDGTTRSR
jgi:hypothetical protein